MTWQQIPFVRLLFSFLLGICLYSWLGASLSSVWLFSFQLILFTILVVSNKKKEPSISFIRWWGALLMLLLVHSGYFISYNNDFRNNSTHIQHQTKESGSSYLATITSVPKLTAKTIKVTLALEATKNTTQTLYPTCGKLIAYIHIDSLSTILQYGDQILFQGEIKALAGPLNPFAFDSRNYYAPKNIYHQVYIPTKSWTTLGNNKGSPLYRFIYSCRKSLLKILKEQINSPNEYAVASALILGAKDKLNTEIKNAYADTGAMHVLAVSGLHVGILVAMLSFLLGLFRSSHKWWKKSKVLLLLTILWGFALLTGASASVLRASTMFTFVIIGPLLDRKINIYNSLGASAFLLLCINSLMLFDIGFQLSYLALIGIIYLHPRIYKLWCIENRLGDWIWNGISISLAAQIATLPIALYYFHQFPMFFWLSGLIVTAAAGIILGLGICLLTFNSIPLLGSILVPILGYLLYGALWLMNSLIFIIQQLPGAVWGGFWLEYWQMWAWYLVIGSSIFVLVTRQLKWAFIPISACLLLFGHRAYINYNQEQQSQLCIYNSRKSTIISYTNGKETVTIADSNLTGSPQMQYAQQNHLWSIGISKNNIHSLQDSIQNKLLYYNNKKGTMDKKRLLLYSQEETLQQSHTPLDVNYVLVHGNPKLKSIQQIEEICSFNKIIFDASNSPWKIDKWIAECQELGIEYVNVSKNGAWIDQMD
jgi:competence protein ComEC